MTINIISSVKCKYWWARYDEDPEIRANAMDSDFYKRVRDSIKVNGIINPLMGIQEDEFVRVKLGNNRLLAARELGITKIPMIMLDNEDDWKIHKKNYDFQPGDIEYERID